MMLLNPLYRVAIFFGAWLVWASPLILLRKVRRDKAVRVDNRARAGVALHMAGYAVVCTPQPGTWSSPLALWRAVAAVALAALSTVVFRSAIASLGPQWRIDAGLNRDHELVRRGAYRFVRHPIYASMLGMLLSDAALIGTMPGVVIGAILFLAGTEIRVRIEDGLLRERFGERFAEWQRSKPAYLPFIR